MTGNIGTYIQCMYTIHRTMINDDGDNSTIIRVGLQTCTDNIASVHYDTHLNTHTIASLVVQTYTRSNHHLSGNNYKTPRNRKIIKPTKD